MKGLDTSLRPLLGRTPREVILIGGGLTICGFQFTLPTVNPWHLGVFVAGTALFAVRFFAARVVAIGILLSAIAAHLSGLRYGAGWVQQSLHWSAYAMGAGVLLLMSRDLQQRFDFGASGPGLRLNRWRELPRSFWRVSTVLGWLLGILGHFLLRGWQPAGAAAPMWPLIAMLVCIAGVMLLFSGHSIVFVITTILGVVVAALVIPQVGAAEALVANGRHLPAPSDVMWRVSPDSALPAAIAAVGSALVSLPYAALHVWKSLRG
ncbi:MAG TPA: hypothetical protein VM261_15700 [Kofleriaceae bacterium]|nr:hypothetical protein [Kofleriaceae bacterium]